MVLTLPLSVNSDKQVHFPGPYLFNKAEIFIFTLKGFEFPYSENTHMHTHTTKESKAEDLIKRIIDSDSLQFLTLWLAILENLCQ